MKILPMGAEFLHEDRHEKAFRKFAKSV